MGRSFRQRSGAGQDTTRVYNKGIEQKQLDEWVRELCSKLKKVKDISVYSLELQVWWRDHQAADRERMAEERKRRSLDRTKKRALAKLTTKERKALGR